MGIQHFFTHSEYGLAVLNHRRTLLGDEAHCYLHIGVHGHSDPPPLLSCGHSQANDDRIVLRFGRFYLQDLRQLRSASMDDPQDLVELVRGAGVFDKDVF